MIITGVENSGKSTLTEHLADALDWQRVEEAARHDEAVIAQRTTPADLQRLLDGLNDALEITGRQIRLFEIWIYNRWGELVYNSTDLDEAWIGDVNGGTHFAPNGVYHWIIKASGFDTDAQEFRGFVHLMR